MTRGSLPAKTNFRTSIDSYIARRGEFRTLLLPTMRYLMVDGHGDPNVSELFVRGIRALYPVAYAMKFASKNTLNRDYVVPPLEGLWNAASMDAFTTARDKNQWTWTLMLMVPSWVDDSIFDAAFAATLAKKNRPERLDDVRLAELSEGLCVQTLHVGPFDTEGEVLQHMHHNIIPELGFRLAGVHHEIYLTDPRRSDPARARTILRQPVQPAHN